jgi:uncharacterized membrane protein
MRGPRDLRGGRHTEAQAKAAVVGGAGSSAINTKPVIRFTDKTELNVYADVYRVLIGGMIVSTCLFIAGVVLALIHPQFIPLQAAWIRQHYSWGVFIQGLLALRPTSLLMLATLLLIATPVVRVLVSIYAFLVDHDYKFVVVTSLVFLVIILTIVLSQLGLT